MDKRRKQKNKGFTLIEILIAMTIFGFLLYVITGILISIIQTVYTASQRSFLRNNMESIITQLSADMQFATNVADCGNPFPVNTCIIMQVPSLTTGNTIDTNTEKVYWNQNPAPGALPSIVKSVNINGSGTPIVKTLSASNVDITNVKFTILNGNVLFTQTGQITTGLNNSFAQLPLSAVIQFNRQ